MTSRQKAEIACLRFDLRALELGAVPSKPMLDVRYDRILDWRGRLWRVQVKYASQLYNGALRVPVYTSYNGRVRTRTYSVSEVDAVVVYSPQVADLLWLPVRLLEGKASLHLRFIPARNKQAKDVWDITQFFWKDGVVQQ